jgi:hypothetical protein
LYHRRRRWSHDRIWLETDEAEQQIRDQLATAMNMQQQKDSLDKLDVETFRPTILKALERSKGHVVADESLRSDSWRRWNGSATAKGQNISRPDRDSGRA